MDILEIITQRRIQPVFQPIFDYRANAYLGFEGLIRGPQGSPYEMPTGLFAEARAQGLGHALEYLCLETITAAFVEQSLPGRLFLNVSPSLLLDPHIGQGDFERYLAILGLMPSRIVFELTENQQMSGLPDMLDSIVRLRSVGFQIAIDDLGEGFANLRLWSELRPEYVKIDRHFIDGIAEDRIKFHFVRAMQDLAEICKAALIAEGVETEVDSLCVRDMGIACCQGYWIARPQVRPEALVPARVLESLTRPRQFGQGVAQTSQPNASSLLREVAPLDHHATNEKALKRFAADVDLDVIPVVKEGMPVGMLNRHVLAERFSRPYQKELFGKRPCELFMDQAPLIVDQQASIQELAMMLALAPKRYLLDGFIITDKGRYLGVGSSHHLMALITEMQISAARYANPLTQLPGNVPTNEHIDSMLKTGHAFVAAYIDIDNFKPFNDHYGYRRGDDVIQLLGAQIVQSADARADFVGHIGGDDFFVVFQSDDWEQRCWDIIARFAEAIAGVVGREEYARGGYLAENRKGELALQPLPTLSIGAVCVLPSEYDSHREVSAAAAIAKKQAKKVQKRSSTPGSLGDLGSIFTERRKSAGRLSVGGDATKLWN